MPSFTLSELAELCGARIEGDGSAQIAGPAGLAEAQSDQVSFLVDRRYYPDLAKTRAAGVLVSEELEDAPEGLALLRCKDPGRAFSQVIEAFTPPRVLPDLGVHPSAVLADGAEVGEGVRIGPLCTVAPGARIGAGVILHSGVHIGAGVQVGEGCELYPGVVLYSGVRLGKRCILHAGAVLGADGFGFEPTAEGWEKTPQGGTVELDDDVEVGANSAIDCARFGETRIGAGTKIDNLVHVAHNVQMGEACLVIAQTGIAGSTRLGRRVILAGQAGVAGHLSLGEGARIGGAAKVFRDVPAGTDVWGYPAMPKEEAVRTYLALPKMARELRDLRKRLAALEKDQA